MDPRIEQAISSLRTLLLLVGGFFVAQGKLSATDLNTYVGAGLAVIGTTWTVYDAFFRRPAQTKAVAVDSFRAGAASEASPSPTPISEPAITAALNNAQILKGVK